MCNLLPDLNGKTECYSITEEAQDKLEKIALKSNNKEKSSIKKIIGGYAKEGLKEIALTASKEIFCAVLSAIPFGNVAKKAIGYVIKAVVEE